MSRFFCQRQLAQLVRDDAGATSIEYALIASVISLSILFGARAIGSALETTYSGVASNLT